MTICLQRHSATAALPARKPLYLLHPSPARIDAGTNHLVLQPANGATLRFPLARVCRIVCNRHLSWTGNALTACLRAGIPITWTDGYGHALGALHPRLTPPQPFSTLIETYLELPDWQQRFANWTTRRRLETLTACALRAAKTGHRIMDPRAFAALKREYVYKGTHPINVKPDSASWCHALVVERLHQEGLQTNYWGFDASHLALADELAALLWAEFNFDAGSIANAHADHTQLSVHLFENWAREHSTRLLQHLGDLKRHLAREIEAWH